jgi:hypothetical protein
LRFHCITSSAILLSTVLRVNSLNHAVGE